MADYWIVSVIVLANLLGSLLGLEYSLCDTVQTVNGPSAYCGHPETCQSMNSGTPTVAYQGGHCILSYGPYGDPKSGTVFNYSHSLFQDGNITALEAEAFVGIHGVAVKFGDQATVVWYGGKTSNSRLRTAQFGPNERVCALDLSTGKIRLSSNTPMVQAVGRLTLFTTDSHKFGPIGLWPDPYVCVNPGNGSYLAYISGTVSQVMNSIMVHFIAPGGYPAWSTWSSCDCSTQTRSRSRCTDFSCQTALCPQGDLNQTEVCVPEGCPPVNGGWSAWHCVSNCSNTCGTGNRNYSRSCDSPTPQYGGLGCSGPTEDTVNCTDLSSCPESCSTFLVTSGSNADYIYRATISSRTSVPVVKVTSASSAISIAVDQRRKLVFWTELGSRQYKASTININGTRQPLGIPMVLFGVSLATNLSRVFFFQRFTGLVMTDYNASLVANLPVPSCDLAYGMATDEINQRVYWAEYSYSRLQWSSYNITTFLGPVNTLSVPPGTSPSGLAIDPPAGILYWLLQADSHIYSMNLTSQKVKDISTAGSSSFGLVFCAKALYFPNKQTGELRRLNLTSATFGINVMVVETLPTSATANNAYALAIEY